MGLFDRLRTMVGAVAGASRDMRGPLRLQPGDGVGYYAERLVVAGVRRIEAGTQVSWHYCLRDQSGATTVLAVEGSAEPTLSIQRTVAAEIPWDKDKLEGIDDETFTLAAHGPAAVEQVGDPGTPPVRQMKYRRFADPSADRTIVLEDYQGQREVRAGEVVHEAELVFVRTADTGSTPGEVLHELAKASGDDDASRGSPDAALAALSESHDCDGEALLGEETPEDRDPTDFDDAEWADDNDVSGPIAFTGPMVEAVADSEDDEWLVAARYLKEHGAPAESKR